jgi:hypothetical protein
MSERWPGGIVRSNPVTPTGPLQNGTAPGVWSLADAAYWTKQGLWPTAGNTLAVEDVFSTWLYTGTGAAQTITNGINLSGQGGLVIQKERSSAYADGWFWGDTVRGANTILKSQNANGQVTSANTISAFSSTGFTAGSNISFSGSTYASWTFREAPNFFDIVTYTGNGANRNIAHNLGSVPGMIIVKRTDTTGDWQVYHRSNANTQYMVLNSTAAVATGTTRWNSTTPTATEFTVGTDATVNASGGTYVAYLYAHDTSSTGVIQCGSYTGNGSSTGPTVTLGWEPQWVMIKPAGQAVDWQVFDTMRGMPATAGAVAPALFPNLASAEDTGASGPAPLATGFAVNTTSARLNQNGSNYIYVAIRRGPMKTPTLGTSVFAPTLATFSGSTITNTGFVVDLAINKTGVATTNNNFVFDRLRGSNNGSAQQTLVTNATDADVASSGRVALTGSVTIQNGFLEQDTTANNIVWAFRRAPGFFDEVCYTGTGATTTQNHNLGVVPELVITKSRSAGSNWQVNYSFGATTCGEAYLNNTNAGGIYAYSVGTAVAGNPTASQVQFYAFPSGQTMVAYLFASCPGVSKVGSYTGTGTTQTVNCGFTTGARFVLIKRTDSTGDWYVWDSARGIVAGNDPYLLLNSTAAEVTSTDYVDTDNSGFQLSSTAPAALNANGGTYIFLAIA